MPNPSKIKDDEHYHRTLEWLVDKAKKLEDPLLSESEKDALMAKYDDVACEAQKYRRAELAQKFPGLRDVYRKLGWEVYEGAPPQPSPETQETPREPEPEQKQPQKSDAAYAAFLDDDEE